MSILSKKSRTGALRALLSDAAGSIGALFYAPRCPVCGEPLGEGMRTFCTRCRAEAPLTGYWRMFDNPLVESFWGLLPVVHASALLFFAGNSGWRRVIHDFKYRGRWRLAREAGHWLGGELAAAPWYGDVDAVVPVPLHWIKRLRRGYNQSEYIAEGIAAELGCPVDRRSVVRRRNNPPQVERTTGERWSNVEELFAVRRPERLRGKHILLVDDVLTTRATMVSCGEAILRAVPDCRISVAVVAAAKHRLQKE